MKPTIGCSCQASKWLTISSRMKECTGQILVWKNQADGFVELKFIIPDNEGMEYTPSYLNCYYYPDDGLITALEEGKLKGKLKEIVQHLDEEDNGVVMMLRRKELFFPSL